MAANVRPHRRQVHGASRDVREAQPGARPGGKLDGGVVGRVEGVAGEQPHAPRGRFRAHLRHVLGTGPVNRSLVPAVHRPDVAVSEAVPVCG